MKPRFTAWLLVLTAALLSGWAETPAGDRTNERLLYSVICLNKVATLRIARILRASRRLHVSTIKWVRQYRATQVLPGLNRVLFQRPPPVLLSRV